MEEVLTIRLPKGTLCRLERRAKAQKLSVSQLVRRALEQDELLTSLASARSELGLSPRGMLGSVTALRYWVSHLG